MREREPCCYANASITNAPTFVGRNKHYTCTNRLQTKNAEQNDLAIRAFRTGWLLEYPIHLLVLNCLLTLWLGEGMPRLLLANTIA
jgi:hypothetical protein